MIIRLADNITSPLGDTTAENYQAVKAGRSGLSRYVGKWSVPEPFTASLFTDQQISSLAVEGFSRFESLAFRSASKAIQAAHLDVTGSNVVFILSSAKANVECLKPQTFAQSGDACYQRDSRDHDPQSSNSERQASSLYPGAAAKRIADRLGFTTEPIVVCNACISGVSAILLALRLLDARLYDYAVICGADVQSKFTVSGFQSLKAVSEDDCRPFDIERIGLNLGEAAATLVVGYEDAENLKPQASSLKLLSWFIRQGAVRNDAFHVSSPSKDGEGARLALAVATAGVGTEDLAVVNAHGTATMFNDQMESVAIERAGLAEVPVNALKGYFGHTMGAAGILETLITMSAIDDHTVLATRGFAEYGVSGKIRLSPHNEPATKTSFIKMISGFGGGNAAILAEKFSFQQSPLGERGAVRRVSGNANLQTPGFEIQTSASVHLTPTSLTIDGQSVHIDETGVQLLTSLYKKYVGDYPKYYKMDGMSRLGFVASELLLRQESAKTTVDCPGKKERFQSSDDRAVILFNHSTSIASDRKYLRSIACPDDYYPSPSVFVYTLPSIVTGEIAMRNNYHGETSFYIFDKRDDALAWQILCASFGDPTTESIIGGWIDYEDDSHFEADIFIAYIKTGTGSASL